MFTPVRQETLSNSIVQQLLQAIFSGVLPGGMRLVEKNLTAEFQVSSTPVREALMELAALGLIEIRPNRGAVVLPFNPENLRGIYHVRMALECEAVRLAINKIPLQDLEAYEADCNELLAATPRNNAWSLRAKKLDAQLHEMIATWAGVTRLATEIRRYWHLVECIDYHLKERQGFRQEEQEKTIRQHLVIIQTLKSGDADFASHAMSTHLQSAVEYSIGGFFPKSRS
jgi:DNA-binding GntR family transcriptional regulator